MEGEENNLPEIPVFRPNMGDEEINAIGEVLKSGWIGLGPKTKEFERKFAEYVGAKYAIATNSCSGALHLALDAIGATKGDEIITTPMTFVSTSHAIVHNGAIPVFVDIDPETLNIDPKEIEKKITPRTKAILIVDYGGHPCELDEIKEIADKNNLVIIEDAAHACGSEYKGKKIGCGISDLTCFSFHAVKNLPTGDGGMITTNNEEFAKRIKRMAWVGMNKDTFERSEHGFSWHYDILDYGFKYHMNDISAALGLVQLGKLEMMNQRRREIARRYDEAFRGLEWIKTPIVKEYAKTSQCNYCLKIENNKSRDELYNHLKKLGISTSVHYRPVYLFTIYQSNPMFRSMRLPHTEETWKKIILLPMFPSMTEEQIQRVIDGVKSFKVNNHNSFSYNNI